MDFRLQLKLLSIILFQSYGSMNFLLILCNFHSFTTHNSVIISDIFLNFNRNVYEVKMMSCLQE